MQLEQLLNAAVRGGASDIILKTNSVPRFRFNGQLIPLSNGEVVRADVMSLWLKQIRPQLEETVDMLDADFAFQSKAGQRFRVNVFKQRGLTGIVMRVVLGHIKTLEELHLPSVVTKLFEKERGLILITGATGSGKSTTMASIIDRINRTRKNHIITIEDPIEYQFEDELSVIEQREVGLDTTSFSRALRAALRQNPDVIMVGEMRDRETVQTALQAAETGHLVLATLHTADATESLQRILGFFDEHATAAISQLLAEVIVGIISQRLVVRADKTGMVAAVEVLVGNEGVKEAIRKGFAGRIRTMIEEGTDAWGMQSFDQSLFQLWQDKMISKEVALHHATVPSDMELKISGLS